MKTIVYKLCQCIPGYLSIISRLDSKYYKNSDIDGLVTSLIINPFNETLNIYPKGKFIFIIDGIDELRSDVLNDFLELLRNYSNSLPEFINIIITSTSIESINSTMRILPVKIVDLTADRFIPYKKDDARRFLKNELEHLNIKYSEKEVDIILMKAGWNFDYLHYFLVQCQERDNDILITNELPIGLTAMFESDFEQRFPEEFFNSKVKPILQILVASKEPLSVDDLSQILLFGMNKLQSIIKDTLKQFLLFSKIQKMEMVSLYNKSLQLWLIQKNHKFCVDEQMGNQAIVNWMKQNSNYLFENLYLRKYGIIHILETGNSNEINAISEKIEKSNEDDFETLKMLLSRTYMSTLQNGQSAQKFLIQIYRSNYSKFVIRYRDLLVYTYRYVLKHKGNNTKLDDILKILCENHEGIRAKILKGEGIVEYDTAKKYFIDTIESTKKFINNTNNACRWWNVRMLGTAYNRLANLENKYGDSGEAEKQYKNGKHCFDEAERLLSETDMMEKFIDDKIIIQRDKAIINERLGDIAFAKYDFENAERYYQVYFESCKQAFDNRDTLRNKWDLSISLLRYGDALRYLGKLNEAKSNYLSALFLRRDILFAMHSEYTNIISSSIDHYQGFECFNIDIPINSNILVDEVPKESRDIDPIRDIAMCYVRLGDLAFFIHNIEVAQFFYGEFYGLCQCYKDLFNTDSSDRELDLSKKRLERLASREVV